MKNFILITFVYLFIALSVSAQDEESVFQSYYLEKMDSHYNEIISLLHTGLKGESCYQLEKKDVRKQCSFQSFCQILARNGDNPVLYENKQGEKIINFKLQKMMTSVESCYATAKAELYDNDLLKTESQTARLNLVDSLKTLTQKKKLEEIDNHAAETEFVKHSFDDLKDRTSAMEGIEKVSSGLGEKSRKLFKKSAKVMNQDKLSYDDWILSKSNNKTGDVSAIFAKVQNSVIDILKERSQKNPENTAKYQEMIKRIQTTRLESQDSLCTRPSAFYDYFEHSVTICPQILSMPESGAMMVIAHELGHAIDPCVISYDLIGNQDKTHSLSAELGSQDKSVVSPGISFSENPFSEVLSCLQSEEGLGANGSGLDGELQKLKEKFSGRLSEPEYLSDKEALAKEYHNHGACSDLGGDSQLQEGFSDWLAGEFVAKDIQTLKKQDRLSRTFESVSPFLGRSCKRSPSPVALKMAHFIKSMGCTFNPALSEIELIHDLEDSMEGKEDEHNSDIDRLEKIFISHPEIKKALSCAKNNGGKYCEK